MGIWRRRAQERGAAAMVLAVVTCFVLLPLSALAVDIGQQRIARKDVQAIADTAALDAVRSITASSTDATVKAAAVSSAASDKGALGNATVDARLGYLAPTATWASNQALGCDGTYTDSYFTYPAPASKANAVLVVVRGTVSFGLGGVVGTRSGTVCRSSIAAVADPTACFSVDSYAAQLKSGNSLVLGPLLGLLGSDVNLTAISSSGIATTNVDVLSFLNALKADLNLGSVDQVLTTNITVNQLLAAEVEALSKAGTTTAAVVTVLNQQLIARLGHLPTNLPFTLASLLNLSQGAGSAVGAQINALDLAMAALNLANGTHALDLSVGTASGIADLSAHVTVIQKPQLTCGGVGTTATTPQIQLTATGSITGGNLVSGLVDVVGATLSLVSCLTSVVTGHCQWISAAVDPFSITASVASATGKLSSIQCNGSTAAGIKVAESSALAPITISLPITISYVDKNIYTGTITTKSTTLTATVSTAPAQPAGTTGSFTLPGDYNQAKAGPSGNLSIDHLSVDTQVTGDQYGLLGGLLGATSTVVNGVNSVLGGIESTVLTPLLSVLTSALHSLIGLDLAGSSFTVVPPTTCRAPQLK